MNDLEEVYLRRIYEKASTITDHYIMGFSFEGRTQDDTNSIVNSLERQGYISKVERYGRNQIRCLVTEKTFAHFEEKC